MSWLGLVLLVLGAYLAYKLVGALLKIAMFALALVGAYWFAAPHMGWPTVSELVYVLGPDFGGKRIEEVVQPSAIADEVTSRVVDGVVERVLPSRAPEAADATLPEPLPEGAADEVDALPERADEAP
ncbi:hypothetical protein FQY83_00495 [Luteimonas marina]|uniref:Uncharacterized protein n=1 Tax=Luteimonas marina TaxID=488485 RepID=A0A5C5UC55_9GAMM|nr:hypothetical protein [Luteimonas marina]TWT23170.1 hypothetical protein FQY83_00495 [Luteimonas marina]